MAVRSALKQPEENTQRHPGEKWWACYYCGKEGHLKRDCPQASKPPLAPCPVCKGPHWKRDCPQRRRSPGSDSQDNQDWRCLGVPTQAPVLITPEEPRVLIVVGGQSVDFLLDTGAKKKKSGNCKHSNINCLNQSIDGKKGKEVNIASITCETISII